MSSKPVLGYWDIRGLAQPIRLLLAYLDVDYEDKRYQLGANFDRSAWLTEKFNLGLDFPNLPYYIDGNVKLSQTLAILRYIGRKYKLTGANEPEELRVSLVEQQVVDGNQSLSRVAYDPNADKLKPDFLKTLPDSVKQLSHFLGNSPFVAGTSITYVDFWLYEYLVKLSVLVPEVFGQFDNLKKFVERIESLPRVSVYIKAQQPKLFNGPMAKWNGQYA
uniref:Glutathione S-transferase n=2 Tax=Acaroidea TaxID=83155 RepID=GSTM_TYRPU|nr:RecName: Full=Glutathione S-transferase; AltName: Full=GST class-mu; AltName: Allergen=Tyr p 8 [Tyrophagus putrescentiae]AAX34055.1 Sui m 8 allergen [Suidasia medanensis]AGG10560.1 Tyr p 8 allergen [Tyrophagus putrescentiae]